MHYQYWIGLGSAAFFGGVSRLTVSLLVIMVEISNDVHSVLPMMLAQLELHGLALLLGLAESQQAVRRFEEALATYSQLQSAIDISKSEKENLDKWMRDEIPGFHRQSFIERSLKRIKTLANSMNSPPSSEILPTNRKK